MKSVKELSLTELRALYARMSHNGRQIDRTVSRSALIRLIEAAAPPERQPKRQTRLKAHLGVGRRARALLAEVIGYDDGNVPVGHSYTDLLEMLHSEFPDSAIDQKHLSWYATNMRSKGAVIPAVRRRSTWIGKK